MRIVGYLSTKPLETLEEKLRAGTPEQLTSLHLETPRMYLWVSHSRIIEGLALVHSEPTALVLIDGTPIIKNNEFEMLTTEKIEELDSIHSDIETNSPILSAKKNDDQIQVTISSSRAGPGKMWYSEQEGVLVFSNDIRILVQALGYFPDYTAIHSIFRFGRVLEPRSISANIQCVIPGFTISASGNPIKLERKQNFIYSFPAQKTTISDFTDLLEKTTDILSSINVDMLMSGGVDSTLLASMFEKSKKTGFYLMFDDDDLELEYAEQAASSTGFSLNIFKMNTEDALHALYHCPESHIQPTVDFSAINTFHLMNQIKTTHQDTDAIIDGNGTEFILGPMTPDKLIGWQRVNRVPCSMRKIARKLYSRSSVFLSTSKLYRPLYPLSRAANCRTDIAPFTVFPINGLLSTDLNKLDEKHTKHLDTFVNLLCNDIDLRSYLTVASIYSSCHVMCSKTYEIGIYPIKALYPFLWKSMLIEQGMMSWGTKLQDSKFKYPLKKMLEKYMPYDFVHRKKSGFTPPMEKWVLDSTINERIQETLESLSPVMRDIISPKRVFDVFLKAKSKQSYPGPILSFIWATMITDLWLRRYASPQDEDGS